MPVAGRSRRARLGRGGAAAGRGSDRVVTQQRAPLILELGATWCGPCRVFAAKVLPRPDVQAALQGTLFVQYDVDVGPGLRAQQRFLSAGNGATYPVPTFVAVDGEGQVKHRLVGLGDPDDPDRFLAFISESRVRLMGDDLLQSTLSQKPEDAMLHAESGRRFAIRGDIPQALFNYTARSPPRRGCLRRAGPRCMPRRCGCADSKSCGGTIRDSAELVRTHPGASNVLTHLALATIGSGLSSNEVGALYKTVLATDRRERSCIGRSTWPWPPPPAARPRPERRSWSR